MIAAVFGLKEASETERLLRRLASNEGASGARLFIDCNGGLLATDRVPTGDIDFQRRFACCGSVRGDLERLDSGELRGDFGLVALRADGLYLARGRFGGRPLYFAEAATRMGRALMVCSRLAPLAASLGRPLHVRASRLAALVCRMTGKNHEETVYREIGRVASGERVCLTLGGVRWRRGSGFQAVEIDHRSPDELAEDLRARILRSVRRVTQGRERVAVLAGGGVDSSGLLAVTLAHARGAGRPEVEAIALDFAGPGDDRPHMRSLADALGIVPVRISPVACAQAALGSLVLDGAPHMSGTGALDVSMARVARDRGANVMLTGVGGDDFFDGDFRVFAARALRGEFFSALDDARRLRAAHWLAGPVARMNGLVVRPLTKAIAPQLALDAWARVRTARLSASAPWAGQMIRKFLEDRGQADAELGELRAPTGESRFAALAVASYMLERSDARAQVEVASGCPRVEPFLDDDVAELLASIPPNLFFYGDRVRGLFRHAIRGLVPDTVRLRDDKAGFTVATLQMFDALGGAGRVLAGFAPCSALGELGLVEPTRARAAFEGVALDPIDPFVWVRLWPLIPAEAFARQVKECESREYLEAPSSEAAFPTQAA